MAQLNFDANTVDPQSSFDPLPAGWYKAMITESEMKPTRNGNGHYLQLTFQVLDGEHAGRIVWDRLNLANPNQVAVEIAQQTLSAICHAVGQLTVKDSAELHNKPMQIKLKVVPATAEYDAKNEISGYKAVDGAPAAVATAAPSVTQPAAATAGNDSAPPWSR